MTESTGLQELDDLWEERMEAHEALARSVAEAGGDAYARQYALTQGHYCRGLLTAGGDRIVRIVDWLNEQRDRGPQAYELQGIGTWIEVILAKRAPACARAVFRPGRNG